MYAVQSKAELKAATEDRMKTVEPSTKRIKASHRISTFNAA
jgi:hypothetical protein